MTIGVVYVATAEPFLQQAVHSARSVKQWNNIDVAIVTATHLTNIDEIDIFDDVIAVKNYSDDVTDKAEFIGMAPYDKVVYLDGDTEVIGDISDLYKILDRVDIAAASSTHKNRVSIKGVPDSFPELNTGVIAYRNSEHVQNFFESWREALQNQIHNGRPNDEINVENGETLEEMHSTGDFGRKHGQIPFREMLYNSDLSYSILPDEYNYGAFGRSHAYAEVKIVHGSDTRRNLLKNNINKKIGSRLYVRGGRNKIIYQYNKNVYLAPWYAGVADYIIEKSKLKKIVKLVGVERQMEKLYKKFVHRD